MIVSKAFFNSKPFIRTPLTPITTRAPFVLVAIDLIDMQGSTSGNRYILTAVDQFSKFGLAAALPGKRAQTVVETLSHMFLTRYPGSGWLPRVILSDKGKKFDNSIFSEFAREMEIELQQTKGYDHRGYGLAERFNRTLENILKKSGEGEKRQNGTRT